MSNRLRFRSSFSDCPIALEKLDDRAVPAVLATFNTDTLVVTGDNAANAITVAAAPDGNLVVTDGATNIPIRTLLGNPTLANLKTVHVDARGGNDSITLARSLNSLDANGKLAAAPNATLLGGSGDDSIAVLSGGFLGGVIGNPIVGNTVMDGGTGNDFLDSGFGNDVMIGGPGNDTLRWLPGTLIDLFDGGSGQDTAIVVGNNNQGDAFVLSKGSEPGRALFQRTNLVPFFIDMTSIETVDLRTGSGDDSITINDLTGTGIKQVLADGGTGNDSLNAVAQMARQVVLNLLGGDGDDDIVGGSGNDFLSGGAGNDTLTGGPGRDVLSGDDGDDQLDGGKDGKQDILIGGAGVDTFFRYRVQRAIAMFDELIADYQDEDIVAVRA